MKKNILITMIALSTLVSATESIDRTGWGLGLGGTGIAYCFTEKAHTDEHNVVTDEDICGALPFLDLSLGYGFTPHHKVSLELKNFLVAGYIGLKTQYYLEDMVNTFYAYAELGIMYAKGYGMGTGAATSIGVGYAKGHTEYDVGVMLLRNDPIFVFTAKYLF